jgi:hypothetical protein
VSDEDWVSMMQTMREMMVMKTMMMKTTDKGECVDVSGGD